VLQGKDRAHGSGTVQTKQPDTLLTGDFFGLSATESIDNEVNLGALRARENLGHREEDPLGATESHA
jgi:hypothetical protein